MRGADKVICQAAAVLLLFSISSTPAKAQFLGGGGAGGEDMMAQMAPMLEMMKAKMGKRRFAMLMQTMGPMMSRMMENGGGGFGGTMSGGYAPMGGGTIPMGLGGMGGGDIMGMLGSSDMMAMIPQMMRLANLGGGGHRRHRHRSSTNDSTGWTAGLVSRGPQRVSTTLEHESRPSTTIELAASQKKLCAVASCVDSHQPQAEM